MYKQVKPKDFKKYAIKIAKKEIYLKEGVYTTFPPNIDDQLFIKTKNNKSND